MEQNYKIFSITDFYEYSDLKKIFYNGSIQTISDNNSLTILNNSEDGAGQEAVNIPIVLNENEISKDEKIVGKTVGYLYASAVFWKE